MRLALTNPHCDCGNLGNVSTYKPSLIRTSMHHIIVIVGGNVCSHVTVLDDCMLPCLLNASPQIIIDLTEWMSENFNACHTQLSDGGSMLSMARRDFAL